jgi:hypothetical protein
MTAILCTTQTSSTRPKTPGKQGAECLFHFIAPLTPQNVCLWPQVKVQSTSNCVVLLSSEAVLS